MAVSEPELDARLRTPDRKAARFNAPDRVGACCRTSKRILLCDVLVAIALMRVLHNGLGVVKVCRAALRNAKSTVTTSLQMNRLGSLIANAQALSCNRVLLCEALAFLAFRSSASSFSLGHFAKELQGTEPTLTEHE